MDREARAQQLLGNERSQQHASQRHRRGHLGLAVQHDLLGAVAGQPLKRRPVRREAHVVRASLLADVQHLDHLGRQLRTFGKHPELGVRRVRPRVEVHRPDVDSRLIHDRCLGVQPAERHAGEHEMLVVAAARGTELVEIHARAQQGHSISRITGVHERHVVRSERVGQDGDLDVALSQVVEILKAQPAGNEIGRGDQQLALRLREPAHDVHLDAHGARFLRGSRQDLRGRIRKGDGGTQGQVEAAEVAVAPERTMTEQIDRRQADREHLRAFVHLPVEAAAQRLGGGAIADDGVDRVRMRAVPVHIEQRCEASHDRADHQHVHVDEVGAGTALEVFVGDVAAAHDRRHAVGNEQLVVHAVVEPAHVTERGDELRHRAPACAAEWIEQAHFDIRKRRQATDQSVGRIEIVDQQAHVHAAQRGIAQAAHDETAAAVVGDQVILDIERVACAIDELHPRVERVEAVGHQAKARLRVHRPGCVGDAHEHAGVGRAPCRGVWPVGLGWQEAARAQHERPQPCCEAPNGHVGVPRHGEPAIKPEGPGMGY